MRNEIAVASDGAMRVQRGRITVDHLCGTPLLSGSVQSERESRVIEDLVRWHDSVRDVPNSMRIAAARRAPRRVG
jgi:osmotically-inducible protein OsmY